MRKRKLPVSSLESNDNANAGGSKRARFNVSSDTTNDSYNEEFDHTESLEKAKIRRGAVRLDGYGSDSSDDDGEALYLRRSGTAKGKQRVDADQDMFASDDDLDENKESGEVEFSKKKKMKYLEIDDIKGQEFDSIDRYDEETDEPAIMAFNMIEEMEEGKFDEAGNYVRNRKDPNAFHDNWLNGLSRRDIEQARIAHERQEQQRRLKEAEEAAQAPMDHIDIWKELLTIMNRGEKLVDTFQRLGGGKKNKLTEEEKKKKKDIEKLTELSDRMMALGHFDIYESSWEQILRNLKKEGAVSPDWMPLERLQALRAEADANADRAEAAEALCRTKEAELNEKEKTIITLNNQVILLEKELEEAQAKIEEAKILKEEEENQKAQIEALQRKISLLENEIDITENNLRDTTEKLRQTDVKAEHFERKVQQLESDKIHLEARVETLEEEIKSKDQELEETLRQINEL
ncbi:3485_t:CDS:2 [Paraglomus occultum]|uniref:3485_t:CDS:1 n=1 Tax=Paraglomus occultum TaxID=144539 RepID=A0A9N8WQI5_9GLOM|nr:3485_t:CDS:2 [Paraglomus occultum]